MAKKTSAMIPWDRKFADYARKGQESVKNIGGGTSVRFRAGSIDVGGKTVPGNKLECVIIGAVAFNGWYKDAYDADNPQPPDCYAFAALEEGYAKTMAPAEQAEEKQSDTCAECAHNEWGTAAKGRGKACGNNIRMGLLLAKDCDDGPSTLAAEMATAKVSPTNLKVFRGYLDAVADEHGRPLWAVKTQVQSLPDSRTQIKLQLEMVDLIEDDAILEALEKRFLKTDDLLMQPFPPRTEKPAPRAKAPARNAKFRGPVTRSPR